MKALIYITMFLMSGIWFSSCKTSRNIEMHKQVDYSREFQYLRNVIESLRLDVNKQTKITSKKLSDLKIENKTVDLSPPDLDGSGEVEPAEYIKACPCFDVRSEFSNFLRNVVVKP